MASLPPVGSRVSIRYRLPAGTAPAMTDVIGELQAVEPVIVVRTKSDGVVEVSPADVVAVRELSVVPVRASEIRTLEHAAALAWPGTEQSWQDGWLLRAGGGYTSRANSAVPLDFSATIEALPPIIDWYRERGLEPWLALPERLLPIRAEGVKHTRVMVTDLTGADLDPAVRLADRPDAAWLAGYERDVPTEVLTAVVDGEVVFASTAAAVGRGAVTTAPDATRWLGISAVHVGAAARRQGHARRLCQALLGWGVQRGATRAYVQVLNENSGAIMLYHSLGFRLHHHHRYVDAVSLTGRRV
ncbi:ribosomal protein S18 acetylase RimI-like enzyme [Mycolicibacterium sp. BK556]|uniref:N-acetylglutamate synthase, CG3035 family n=1 Tax=unclassified Mycolicibacterium TaxID=2636767 RepID=UPI0016139ED5|nr:MULTISPECIES: GNAT family N-acetyltransferase [unclassified Mycolicibacterium]MBB3605076.1 ribosomal protein S18 acetylase RimI-like enzyme [Mycolicibacterium sp. BK556]MBB3635272.1 ribosomal protein S18 acetylase RimI-like enzyme [Mycolicibacterium sp. BK607]